MKTLIGMTFLAVTLWAHPHVFVDAKLRIFTGANGVEKIAVTWVMDEMTSQLFLMDFDANANGKLEPDEVAFMKQESFNHLIDYNYFLRLFIDGREAPLNVQAQNFTPAIENHRLVYRFELPRQTPLKPGQKMRIQVADEEGYMAMTLKKSDVAFEGAAQPDFSVKQIDHEFYYAWVVDFARSANQKLAAR
ncbi:MAG: DUF1007 family protein [Campylobacterales bacterium]